MAILVLVGAEGVSELGDVAWLRDTTPEDLTTFKTQHHLTDEQFADLCLDGTGRPYFLMAVLHNAPSAVRKRALRYQRVVRLQ